MNSRTPADAQQDSALRGRPLHQGKDHNEQGQHDAGHTAICHHAFQNRPLAPGVVRDVAGGNITQAEIQKFAGENEDGGDQEKKPKSAGVSTRAR